jgi:hypothetical protein
MKKVAIDPTTILHPHPVLLVGTFGTDGKSNLMNAAWGGICCSDPPCVAVSLRKATLRRDHHRDHLALQRQADSWCHVLLEHRPEAVETHVQKKAPSPCNRGRIATRRRQNIAPMGDNEERPTLGAASIPKTAGSGTKLRVGPELPRHRQEHSESRPLISVGGRRLESASVLGAPVPPHDEGQNPGNGGVSVGKHERIGDEVGRCGRGLSRHRRRQRCS